jgi:GT2 family glycosyltransferase/glycosyltransferase involved in cell wall biosynthesis
VRVLARRAVRGDLSRKAGQVDGVIGFGSDPPDPAELALEAMERGRAAMDAGDDANAIRWFDRACRLLPRDPTLKVLFAAATARIDPVRSRRLFMEVAGAHDVAEIRVGLGLADPPGQSDTAWNKTEGFVELADGFVNGWAWNPHRPSDHPRLQVVSAAGAVFTVIPTEPGAPIPGVVLGRPRAFRFPADRFGDWVRILGADGRDLLGSPIVFGAEAMPAQGGTLAVPPRVIPPPRQVDVVVPVCGGGEVVVACLKGVLQHLMEGARLIIVDDGTDEAVLGDLLRELCADARVRLIRQSRPGGFPSAANAGLREAVPNDVVLLNSDTLVAPYWLERLRSAAYSAGDIGTVTPFSNNASILSYPESSGENPTPDEAETMHLAELAHRANGGGTVEIPVGVGFCMYVRRDCLDSVGLLRTDLFAQGYGEENDFCLRAARLGWRHVAAADVFVAHHGGTSFGHAGGALRQRNEGILNRVHPGYDDLVREWVTADPLAAAPFRFDLECFRAGQSERCAVLLLTHSEGGGVERRVTARCAEIEAEGLRPIVLRPDPENPRGGVVVGEGAGENTRLARVCVDGRVRPGHDGKVWGARYPNLRFRLPAEQQALVAFVQEQRPVRAEFHHLLGHHPAVRDLAAQAGVPYEIHTHDYGWFCPRLVLINGDRQYCGEPEVGGCEACIAAAGSVLEGVRSVAQFRRESGEMLRGASRVVAPSSDVSERLERYFLNISVTVVPHETELAMGTAGGKRRGGIRRVCVIGAIGVTKGYDVLLSCANDAAGRDLPLEFIVVGTTIDDRALLATGRVFVTGRFEADEVVDLIRRQQADVAWLPSICPEAWCFALSDAWRGGLRTVVFDIGTQAERVRNTTFGFVLPLGLPPSRINDMLLAVCAR